MFCRRLEDYLRAPAVSSANATGSIVFDMLNVAQTFGLLNDVTLMAQAGQFWSKADWKKRVWRRAWELDGYYWRVQTRLHRSLDLLSKVCEGPKYSIWWELSDNNIAMMRCCEVMVKLLTHASLLRSDDVRLKRLPAVSRFCNRCDLAAIDDVEHLVLQCPFLQPERTMLFN